VSSSGLFPGGFLPTPSQVASGWWTWAFGPPSQLSWVSGTFFPYCWMSMERVYLGFAIGAALGLSLGILIGWYKLAADLLDPMVQILRPIPMTAWLPFATLVFGIQDAAGVALIAMGCFFPIVLNTTSGARQTPQLLVRAALMLGTKPRRLPLRVVIPAALPSIVTGLRLGLGLAWVLVIVAEIIAVRGGLGFAIWGAYQFLRTDLIISDIIALGLLGWASDLVLRLIASRLMRWQRGLIHQ
jgi:NitT/TauT family transport system permease protein